MVVEAHPLQRCPKPARQLRWNRRVCLKIHKGEKELGGISQSSSLEELLGDHSPSMSNCVHARDNGACHSVCALWLHKLNCRSNSQRPTHEDGIHDELGLVDLVGRVDLLDGFDGHGYSLGCLWRCIAVCVYVREDRMKGEVAIRVCLPAASWSLRKTGEAPQAARARR